MNEIDDTNDAWWAQQDNDEQWMRHMQLAKEFKQELINHGILRKPKETNHEIPSETEH